MKNLHKNQNEKTADIKTNTQYVYFKEVRRLGYVSFTKSSFISDTDGIPCDQSSGVLVGLYPS